MKMTQEKKYLLNAEPITAYELIKEACECCSVFKNQEVKSTKEAARVIRNYGGKVEVHNLFIDNGI